ncbi:MAG: 5-formyltetrahydrofolate cyclo-ligase [Acetobacteraceae bacterium]|nr:5-formyltetrahydrofolate cyclo-ligase [Acetobacteraceae bacterium]MBV8523833.1 5-formyltetrahydrofolate cyclo-ligase [Acetobacteraceae bacterium]
MAAPHTSDDLREAKRVARAWAAAQRAGSDPALGALLAKHVLAEAPPPDRAVVAGFLPHRDEIDVEPLLHRLIDRGHVVVLPVTPARGRPLTFRVWRPGDVLLAERFGTFRPTGPELKPDYLLVPLLAFDRRGHRLGYGAGYYDRTLAGLPGAYTLGCAFAAQEMDEVPAGPHDIALDAIATERGVIRCRSLDANSFSR